MYRSYSFKIYWTNYFHTSESPALEANSSPDFRNLKLLHHMHRIPPPVPVLNKTSPIYALPPCLLQILLVLSSHLHLVIPRDLYFKFPQQYTVCIPLLFLTSHIPCSSHHPLISSPNNTHKNINIYSKNTSSING
jgi:hypothetical protein